MVQHRQELAQYIHDNDRTLQTMAELSVYARGGLDEQRCRYGDFRRVFGRADAVGS